MVADTDSPVSPRDAGEGAASPPADGELVRRVRAGDGGAFEALVRRYSDQVVRFAYHMIGDYQAGEDVAQEACLKAYAHIGRLDDPDKFGTWLYSIARHCCLDWIRSRRPAASVEELDEAGQALADESAPRPEKSIETDELTRQVMDALASLRPDYREMILLKHVQELSYNDISEIVGLSISAVGEKLSRVRQMLREKLRRRS